VTGTVTIGAVPLLLADVLLVWQCANYLLGADPVAKQGASRRYLSWLGFRGIGASAMTLLIAGWWPGALLAGVMLAATIMLPLARSRWAYR
jgi:hypothetical protein